MKVRIRHRNACHTRLVLTITFAIGSSRLSDKSVIVQGGSWLYILLTPELSDTGTFFSPLSFYWIMSYGDAGPCDHGKIVPHCHLTLHFDHAILAQRRSRAECTSCCSALTTRTATLGDTRVQCVATNSDAPHATQRTACVCRSCQVSLITIHTSWTLQSSNASLTASSAREVLCLTTRMRFLSGSLPGFLLIVRVA